MVQGMQGMVRGRLAGLASIVVGSAACVVVVVGTHGSGRRRILRGVCRGTVCKARERAEMGKSEREKLKEREREREP